jgi:hypothetical protein
MKISVWERLEVRSSDLEKDGSIEKELQKAQEEFSSPKVKKEMDALDNEIWEVYEEVRRAQVLRSQNLDDLTIKFRAVSRKKQSLKDAFYTLRERISTDREALARSYRDEAIHLLEDEQDRLLSKYIAILPDLRETESGRELGIRGHHNPPGSEGPLVMTVRTNATDIQNAKGVLIQTRQKVMRARSLKELRQVLDEFQAAYDAITFEAKDVEVEEREFERLDISRPSEVAMIVADKIIFHKESPKVSVDQPSRVTGRNPW